MSLLRDGPPGSEPIPERPLAEEVQEVKATRRRLAETDAREGSDVSVEEVLSTAYGEHSAGRGPREPGRRARANRHRARRRLTATLRPCPGRPISPSVSVIVPVRDGDGTIAECLDAILATDYPADRREILVVDNGSTDGTAARDPSPSRSATSTSRSAASPTPATAASPRAAARSSPSWTRIAWSSPNG